MKITPQQIREIADNLDFGLRCFIHLKTGEIETVPDFFDERGMGYDPEPWQEAMDKIEEHGDDYFEFEKMTTHESFDIMTDFAEQVEDEKLQERLYRALNRAKPFRNFRWEIDNAGEYREKWFEFKNKKLIEFVNEQIKTSLARQLGREE